MRGLVFATGVIVGALLGFVTAAMCAASAMADRRAAAMQQPAAPHKVEPPSDAEQLARTKHPTARLHDQQTNLATVLHIDQWRNN